MRDLRACRCCLNTDGNLHRISAVQKRTYTELSGVEMSQQNGYPEYLCAECQSLLKKVIQFRRKVRRACFVLKELRAVKKELLLADLKTVNREKTNLTSNLEVSAKDKCYYYTIDNEEDKIVKQELDFNSNIFNIEIQSANVTNYEIEEPANEEFIENIDNTEYNTEENLLNIDLEDVFKDLEEESSEESDDEVDLFDKEVPERTKKKNEIVAEDELAEQKRRYRDIANVLCKFKLQSLNVEEQIEKYKKILNTEPFKSSPYKCFLCLIIFCNFDELEIHLKEHCKKTVYNASCVVCKMKFETEEERDSHQMWSHQYCYNCKECDKVFSNLNQARGHRHPLGPAKTPRPLKGHFSIISVDPQTMYLRAQPASDVTTKIFKKDSHSLLCCDICKQKYKFQRHLSLHMINTHLYEYKCNRCSNILYSRQDASKHLRCHESVLSNQCQYCEMKVMQKNMFQHIERHHYFKYYKNHCPVCGVSFTSEYRLYFHQLNEHKCLRFSTDKDLEYRCEECNINFVSNNALQLHQSVHSKLASQNTLLSCTMCLKIFNVPTEYKEHISICNKVSSFPIDCQHCGEKIHDDVTYLAHYKENHANKTEVNAKDRQDLCYICGVTTKLFCQHFRRRHYCTNLCSHCGILRSTPMSLFVHQLHHHTRNPYWCALCPARFQTRSECKDHILKIHAMVNPFNCDMCDAAFSHLDYLKKHIKTIHNGNLKTQKCLRLKHPPKLVYIYPFMKINVSSIDKDLFDVVRLYSLDFNNKNHKMIKNPEHYYVIDDNDVLVESIGVRKRTKDITDNDDDMKRKKKPKTINRFSEHSLTDNDFVLEENIVSPPQPNIMIEINDNNDVVRNEHKSKKLKIIKKSNEYLLTDNDFVLEENIVSPPQPNIMIEINDNNDNDVVRNEHKSKKLKINDNDEIINENEYLCTDIDYVLEKNIVKHKEPRVMIKNIAHPNNDKIKKIFQNKKIKVIKNPKEFLPTNNDNVVEEEILKPQRSKGMKFIYNAITDENTTMKNSNENGNDYVPEENIVSRKHLKAITEINDKNKNRRTNVDYHSSNDVSKNNDNNESSLNLNDTNDSNEEAIVLSVDDLSNVTEINGEYFIVADGVLYRVDGVSY